MPLNCGLGHSALQGLHIAVATANCGILSKSRVHPPFIPPPKPRHSFLSCTILLACLTPKPLFFKQSFMVSIYLFHYLHTERIPAYFPSYTLLAILSPSILSTCSNHRRTPSLIFSSTPFVTPLNCLIRATSEVVPLYSPNPRPLLLPPSHYHT